jgi:hypothetical protein
MVFNSLISRYITTTSQNIVMYFLVYLNSKIFKEMEKNIGKTVDKINIQIINPKGVMDIKHRR